MNSPTTAADGPFGEREGQEQLGDARPDRQVERGVKIYGFGGYATSARFTANATI
ncbi:hypothetical protein ACIPWL_21515 [Streptomyces sp. NPDC090023]|uniref:hypothetical protein n=1 Tax=unclassified Streptomyces TaxID=2593676 RepID=UPI00382CED33